MLWPFRRDPWSDVADTLYQALVARARAPVFYMAWSVPDTVPGRFEMVALHAFLVLRRLKRDRPKSEALSQALFDRMFADMDHNLRELGVGDLGVGKRVKAMAKSFYGRVTAYEAGLREPPPVLQEALVRNVYGGAAPEGDAVASLETYVRAQDACLADQPSEALLAGRVRFDAPAAP